VGDVKVIVDPEGASSGTFWQPAAASASTANTPRSGPTRRERVTMRTLNILIAMQLRGQDAARRSEPRCEPRGEHGYAMAALLVGLSVMAVLMSVALPVWKQQSQREKEAELVFRGEQFARAVGLFQRKNGPGTLPPNIDVLVNQRFLRRKFKDPIT